MQYRPFGKLGWQVSALGFGAMRFPTLDGGAIDEPEATRMLRTAIDAGLNYIDSGYRYHDGNSESFLGRALKDGYRDRVRLATKLPPGLVKESADFDRILNEQLARLQTDHLDLYLFHGLSAANWQIVKQFDLLSRAEAAMADGRVGGLGFSFHDGFEAFKEIIDGYPGWAMCQIQYNYLNEDFQAGTRGLEYAASRGLAVVVMEPLLGGKLADPPPSVRAVFDAAPVQRTRAVFDAAPVQRTPAEWALRWVLNKPQVSLALSGMSTMPQVEENLRVAGEATVGMMTAAELDVIRQAREAFEALCPVGCTGCRYCMPCPQGVNIPKTFEYFNRGAMHGAFQEARGRYAEMKEEERAANCIQCRECEAKCPQGIWISEWMPYVHAVLGEGQEYDPDACPQH